MDRTLVWLWRNLKQINRWFWWLIWSVVLVIVGAYFMTNKDADRTFFMPGPSIGGHHQIEEKCDLCHDAFGGIRQKKCLACHEVELNDVNDSHGYKKFRDPRNSKDLNKINVRKCRVCHIDHKLENTNKLGVSIANDFCIHCHRDIAKERPTHKDLPFEGCIECHNYHDNSGLEESYLEKHFDEPETLINPLVPKRDYLAYYNRLGDKTVEPLFAEQHDASDDFHAENPIVELWAKSSHAKAGINCKDCHQVELDGVTGEWQRLPPIESCQSCHQREMKSFKESRHGMRLAQDLAPMKKSLSRLPMRNTEEHQSLGCHSCHSAHDYDTTNSVVDACLSCHNDKHTIAYKKSKHYDLYLAEKSGEGKPGSGVTCATCHLPREYVEVGNVDKVVVQHNQNLNLRPYSKQIKSVCSRCHGLGFTLDSLADKALVENNFIGKANRHLASLEMMKTYLASKEKPEKIEKPEKLQKREGE